MVRAYDLAAFQTPLTATYEACEMKRGSVNSLSLVRYWNYDYSVPTAFGQASDPDLRLGLARATTYRRRASAGGYLSTVISPCSSLRMNG